MPWDAVDNDHGAAPVEVRYHQHHEGDERSLVELLADFRAARQSSLTLFESLPDQAWDQRGTTNGRELTARCIHYICLGHAAHHLDVIRERYLPGLK